MDRAETDIDRDLLFGVLAMQRDMIDQARFAEACAVWALKLDRPLADVLVGRGWLGECDRRDVERDVERKLRKHRGDVRATLGAVAGSDARDALRSVEHPEVRRSLSGLPPAPGHVLIETLVSPGPPCNGSRYRLTRVHAEGGLGRVWLARDSELNREVALKEIRPDHAGDPDARQRFLKEAQITGQLEHPGIVPVYEFARRQEDGQPYYVMQFVRGRTLRDAIAEHHRRPGGGFADRLGLRALLDAFLKVCQTVAYAHSRAVVHRDLKPDNVVLGAFGEAVLLDWGLATVVDRPEASTGPADASALVDLSGDAVALKTLGLVGTPAYMAPEQVECLHDRIDARTDVYALGGILFEILTGRPPAEGTTTAEVFRKILDGAIPRVRDLAPAADRALEAVCAKALSRDRADRYPGATDLAEDVRRWMAGESVSVYRDWLAVRLMRQFRRYRKWVPLLACVAFFDVLVVTVALIGYVDRILHMTTGRLGVLIVTALVLTPLAAQAGAAVGLLGGLVARRLPRRLGWTPDVGGSGPAAAALAGAALAVVALLAGLLGSHTVDDLKSFPLSPSAKSDATAPSAGATDYPRLPGSGELPSPRLVSPGAPFDVAAFLAPVPPEENAAPLYLDALMEFDPGMADCFPEGEGRRRAAIARRRQGLANGLLKAWGSDRASVDRAALDALLEEYAVGFLKLEQAQRRPRCVFQTALSVDAPLPHTQAARAVGRGVTLRAGRALERGDVEGALDDVARLLRLARDLRHRAPVVGQLVASAIEWSALKEILPEALAHPGLKPEQCDRLTALLRDHAGRSPDPFAEGVRSEYLMFGHSLSKFVEVYAREQRLGGSTVRNALRKTFQFPIGLSAELRGADLDRYGPEIDAQLARKGAVRFREDTEQAWVDYTKEVLTLETVPLRDRGRRYGEVTESMLRDHPLVRYLAIEDCPALVAAYLRAEAVSRGALALVALRRWQLTGGDPSADLAAIARASGLPDVPADPYRPDGGPLRLAVVDGEPLVYSIGPDDRDDGGRIEAESKPQPRGDLRFRIKAK
jgi:hypothetical protein